MRCAKMNCQEQAVEGFNYCDDHLSSRGAPRPGVGMSRRSAIGAPAKKAAAKKAPAKKPASKKAATKRPAAKKAAKKWVA